MACYSKHIYKHKYLEIELIKIKDKINYFHFSCYYNKCTDHAGFHLSFELFRIYFNFSIYDNRHWDYYKKGWKR